MNEKMQSEDEILDTIIPLARKKLKPYTVRDAIKEYGLNGARRLITWAAEDLKHLYGRFEKKEPNDIYKDKRIGEKFSKFDKAISFINEKLKKLKDE